MTSWWRNQIPMSIPMYIPYYKFFENHEYFSHNWTNTNQLGWKWTLQSFWGRMMYHVTSFLDFENFVINMDRIWRWRHRTWPDSEKSSAQYKFAIDYDKKRIKSISLTSFEKKIQNWPSLKKKSTLVFKLQTVQ